MNKNNILTSLTAMILCVASISVKAEVKPLADDVNEQEILGLVGENDAKKNSVPADWGNRDPFDSSYLKDSTDSKSEGRSSGLHLQGIFLGTDRPSVIIADTVVGVGEVVKGLTVKSIKEDSVVVVNTEGKEKVLSMSKE